MATDADAEVAVPILLRGIDLLTRWVREFRHRDFGASTSVRSAATTEAGTPTGVELLSRLATFVEDALLPLDHAGTAATLLSSVKAIQAQQQEFQQRRRRDGRLAGMGGMMTPSASAASVAAMAMSSSTSSASINSSSNAWPRGNTMRARTRSRRRNLSSSAGSSSIVTAGAHANFESCSVANVQGVCCA